jgi:hypothetical protein
LFVETNRADTPEAPMRIPHHQLLALASLSTVSLANHVPFAYNHALGLDKHERPDNLGTDGT